LEFEEQKNLMKMGGSLVVVLPSMWTKIKGLQDGDPVNVKVTDDAIIITKIKGK